MLACAESGRGGWVGGCWGAARGDREAGPGSYASPAQAVNPTIIL